MIFVLIIVFIALCVHLLRTGLAYKAWAAPAGESFKGELFSLGDNLVCVPDRSHLSVDVINKTTVICFPGFLEDMRFFLNVHKNTPARLIIINNANYQNPFSSAVSPTPEWFQSSSYLLGTIAHDAHCMNQVLKNMTGNESVLLHGHSRGGAVVLEAGVQQPEQSRKIQALLEAAVVPQGLLAGRRSQKQQPISFYFLPFVLTSWRLMSPTQLMRHPMMQVSNAYKEKIAGALPFAPRQYTTAVTSAKDIIDWQAKTAITSYTNYHTTTLVVGEKDHVLSRKAMLRSANSCPKVEVIETLGTNHFPSLEKPEVIHDYFHNKING
ncbi:MAG: pimeloyl-ACP methyl ester carboxylesterase [Paraglaciecola sp.]|jgi:pimeloyl-ACP methyl ester carboxylesterase